MDRTDLKIDTPVTRGRSGPVRYELIDKLGTKHGPFQTTWEAVHYASQHWPGQEQDEDRTGAGWDVQVVGCDR